MADEKIPLQCPGCGARMNAPPAAAGRTLKCPKCGKGILVQGREPNTVGVEPDSTDPPKRQASAKRASSGSRTGLLWPVLAFLFATTSIGLGAFVLFGTPLGPSYDIPDADHESPEALAKSYARMQQSMRIDSRKEQMITWDKLKSKMETLIGYYADVTEGRKSVEEMQRWLEFIRQHESELFVVVEPEVSDVRDSPDGKKTVTVKWIQKQVGKDGDTFVIKDDNESSTVTCVQIDGKWKISGGPSALDFKLW